MNHTCCTMRFATCACGATDHTDEEHNYAVLRDYLFENNAPVPVLRVFREIALKSVQGREVLSETQVLVKELLSNIEDLLETK